MALELYNPWNLICHQTKKPNKNLRFSRKGISQRNDGHFRTEQMKTYPVGWGCRIYQLYLCRGVSPLPPNECPGYDTKQFDAEVPVMLELWGMRSTPSLWSPPDPLCPGVAAVDRVLSMSQIELNCVLMLNWIVCSRTVSTFNCKQKLYLY